MKIALDFDGTFTADPQLWLTFIIAAEDAGHEVRIVTMRCAVKDGINWMAVGFTDPPAKVVWCDGHAKREWCRQIGWEPDIWIDDDPYSLVHGSKWRDDHPELVKWRVTDKYKKPAGATNVVHHDVTRRGSQHVAHRGSDPGEPKRKPTLQRRRPAE